MLIAACLDAGTNVGECQTGPLKRRFRLKEAIGVKPWYDSISVLIRKDNIICCPPLCPSIFLISTRKKLYVDTATIHTYSMQDMAWIKTGYLKCTPPPEYSHKTILELWLFFTSHKILFSSESKSSGLSQPLAKKKKYIYEVTRFCGIWLRQPKKRNVALNVLFYIRIRCRAYNYPHL